MLSRTKDDLCLLCGENESLGINSHFTPNCLIQHIVGRRSHEEIYTISSHIPHVKTFIGRSNLSNTDPTIVTPDHMAKFIFCKECETALKNLEDECCPFLSNIDTRLGKLPVHKTKGGNKFIVSSKPNSAVLSLFFYSVIWRQIIQQKLLGNEWQDQAFEKLLRNILNEYIKKPIKNIAHNLKFHSYPALIALTTYPSASKPRNYIGPATTFSNPELFFAAVFNLLVFHDTARSPNLKLLIGLRNEIVDDELMLNNFPETRITLLNEGPWQKPAKLLSKRLADVTLDKFILQLVAANGWPYEYAADRLNTEASKFRNEYPRNYIKCLEIAMKNLLP